MPFFRKYKQKKLQNSPKNEFFLSLIYYSGKNLFIKLVINQEWSDSFYDA